MLLALDVSNPGMDDLNAIFRSAHSIKGGAGTFGFNDMTEVTHVLETLLDKLRKQEMTLTDEMVSAFLEAGDVISTQLAAHRGEGEVDQAEVKAVCEKLERLTSAKPALSHAEGTSSGQAAQRAPAAPQMPTQVAAQPQESAYGFFDEPTDGTASHSADELTSHSTRLSKDASQVAGYTPQSAGQAAGYSHSTKSSKDHADPGYGFFDEDFGVPPQKNDEQNTVEQGYGFFTETPVEVAARENEQGYGFFQELQPTPSTASVAPAVPKNAPAEPVSALESAGSASTGKRPAEKIAAAPQAESSIRVSVEKVDQLINLAGELVITQAMLAQSALEAISEGNEHLQRGLHQLERNTRDLQEAVMSIRMMPISFVFSRFPRLVRDLGGQAEQTSGIENRR